MKKPIVALRSGGDVLKILLSIILCIWALSLYRGENESITVFASDNNGVCRGSLYGLVGSLL